MQKIIIIIALTTMQKSITDSIMPNQSQIIHSSSIKCGVWHTTNKCRKGVDVNNCGDDYVKQNIVDNKGIDNEPVELWDLRYDYRSKPTDDDYRSKPTDAPKCMGDGCSELSVACWFYNFTPFKSFNNSIIGTTPCIAIERTMCSASHVEIAISV